MKKWWSLGYFLHLFDETPQKKGLEIFWWCLSTETEKSWYFIFRGFPIQYIQQTAVCPDICGGDVTLTSGGFWGELEVLKIFTDQEPSKKNLVGWVIQEIILPSSIGIIYNKPLYIRIPINQPV